MKDFRSSSSGPYKIVILREALIYAQAEGEQSPQRLLLLTKDSWQNLGFQVHSSESAHLSPPQFSDSSPCQSSSPGVGLEFVFKLNFLLDMLSQFCGLRAMANTFCYTAVREDLRFLPRLSADHLSLLKLIIVL